MNTHRYTFLRAFQISAKLTQPEYVVETKYDGDRMLLHYEHDKPIKVYTWVISVVSINTKKPTYNSFIIMPRPIYTIIVFRESVQPAN